MIIYFLYRHNNILGFIYKIDYTNKTAHYREKNVAKWCNESPKEYDDAINVINVLRSNLIVISQEEANRICKAWWDKRND